MIIVLNISNHARPCRAGPLGNNHNHYHLMKLLSTICLLHFSVITIYVLLIIYIYSRSEALKKSWPVKIWAVISCEIIYLFQYSDVLKEPQQKNSIQLSDP